MPQVPFYQDFQGKPNEKAVMDLTDAERDALLQDYEEIKAERDYHRRFQARWKMAGELYNVIQRPPADDNSNFAIGLSRSIVDFGVTVLNQGKPEFDYAPAGDADAKKVILWKSLVDHLLNKCDWRSHQERWITDLLIFGSSPIEVYNERPYRRRRYEKPDGSIMEKVVRDFRRSKVGIRHRDLFTTWRNPYVSNPNDVPTGGYREVLTWNQFVQNYASAYEPDGSPRYKNVKKLPKAPKVRVTVRFDEIQDVFRIYALPFGTAEHDWLQDDPDDDELGMPIFDKPLTRYRLKVDGTHLSGGANVPGMVPLCFGTFADQLDRSLRTHAVYGMGVGQLIEGHEKMLAGLFNMSFDNMRLKNTVVLSYKGDILPDIDNIGYFDTGRLIPGEFQPQSLGIADLQSNQVMWEWIQNFCKLVTGFTYDQMIDVANAATAFQAGLQVRANNMRVKQRLTSLENGPLKRAGLLLLANALSEVTQAEWEELTETQAEEIAGRIAAGDATGEDYELGADGRPARRRVVEMIPVKGRKFREEFRGSRKRKLDYGSTENTLVEDPEMEGDTSHVPAVREYLYPSEDVESIMRFDVRVDATAMLFDLKAQESGELEKVLATVERLKVTPGLDGRPLMEDPQIRAILLEWLRINKVDESKVFPEENDKSKLLKTVSEIAQSMESPPPDAQPPQLAPPAPVQPPAPAPGPLPQPGAAPQPPRALQDLASGAL